MFRFGYGCFEWRRYYVGVFGLCFRSRLRCRSRVGRRGYFGFV